MDAAVSRGAAPVTAVEMTEDHLLLDSQTFRDLEIFGSENDELSLYDFCNQTRSNGGARVLRRRMQAPWSNAARIHATQDSIRFIIDNRDVFHNLPSYFTATRVDRYLRELLPMVTDEGPVEFAFGALSLWMNYDSHYLSIVRGVQFTSAMVRVLRRLVAVTEAAKPVGELADLIDEMRELLARPMVQRVTPKRVASWAWVMLRLDQGFRLHDKRTITRLLELAYEIDALVSMADVTVRQGFVMPEIETGPLRMRGEGLVHPYIHNPVANPVELDQVRRVLFLTGPNMAGKTTYLRAVATALYLGHLGMGVPARQFSFVPAQRLYSSISLFDDLREGVSYFRAEALRVKTVAEAVADGYRVIALMDEPFKGTNIKDAFDASLAVLERFAVKQDCLFVFSSHLIELSEQVARADALDCRYFAAEESGGRLRFDYVLRPGISDQRLGMRVLREEGVFDLLDKPRKS